MNIIAKENVKFEEQGTVTELEMDCYTSADTISDCIPVDQPISPRDEGFDHFQVFVISASGRGSTSFSPQSKTHLGGALGSRLSSGDYRLSLIDL